MSKCIHEKSYTEKKTKHMPSGYSLFTNCSFNVANNKLDCYKEEDCMESLNRPQGATEKLFGSKTTVQYKIPFQMDFL